MLHIVHVVKELENTPLNQYCSCLKWNGSDSTYINYMMQPDKVLICLPPNTLTVFNHNHVLTQKCQNCQRLAKNQILLVRANILHSVKILKQEGHVTLNHSPEASSIMRVLVERSLIGTYLYS